MIESLEPNEFFVFGSNLAGNHAGGAARYAMEHFGAEEGIGEGLTRRCYAFPTLSSNLKQRFMEDMKKSRDKFYATARALPEKIFSMSAVGTGIAGYSQEEMEALFSNPPENVILPPEWL